MSLYLTTTDAEVLATIERNAGLWPDWRERALAWAAERGADTFLYGNFVGTTSVTGLPIQPEGFGRWTKPNHRGASKPFTNNADEMKAMRALRFTVEPIPGLPEAMHSNTDANGQSYLMYPTAFLAFDAAWVGYQYLPEERDREKVGPQWAECLPSKYHAAVEEYQGRAA